MCIFNKLGIGVAQEKVENLLIRVQTFLVLADFVIMDFVVNDELLIIL